MHRLYTSKAKAQAHIDAGAKKVVISAPAGNDLPTIVYSVNEKSLKPEDTIISAASCTTNCLAPMADTLNKLAPIVKGFMTTIHAYTGDQMVLDGPHRKGDLRRAAPRLSISFLIPRARLRPLDWLFPSWPASWTAPLSAVPVCTGSVTELVAVVDKKVSAEEINAAMKAASALRLDIPRRR